jgi:hypothetical protein
MNGGMITIQTVMPSLSVQPGLMQRDYFSRCIKNIILIVLIFTSLFLL